MGGITVERLPRDFAIRTSDKDPLDDLLLCIHHHVIKAPRADAGTLRNVLELRHSLVLKFPFRKLNLHASALVPDLVRTTVHLRQPGMQTAPDRVARPDQIADPVVCEPPAIPTAAAS
jgi:hypothetical protein